MAKEDPGRAIAYAREAREKGFTDPILHRTLGHLFAETGQYGESLKEFSLYLDNPVAGDEPEREAARAFVNDKVLPHLLPPK